MMYSADKMKALVLHVARAQNDDFTFGRVKLAKLLYYIDMESYIQTGEPVTGATYMKRKEGPAAREFVPLRDQMLAHGDAVEVSITYPNGMVGKKLEARVVPQDGVLTQSDRSIADDVVDRFNGWSGNDISIYSHLEIGWQVAEMDDPIPYNAYFLAPTVTEAHLEKAQTIAFEHGLADAS